MATLFAELGTPVGRELGYEVGSTEGWLDGSDVGCPVGPTLGRVDGCELGRPVGS